MFCTGIFLITKDCKGEDISYAAYVQVKTVFIHRTLRRQTIHLWKTGFSVCGSATHKPFRIYNVCWFGSSHTSEDITSKMRTVFSRVTTQRAVVIPYWHGTTYWSLLKAQETTTTTTTTIIIINLNPWRWDCYVVLKHWPGISNIHCIITQKSAVLIY
jgi:hypothetical protein